MFAIVFSQAITVSGGFCLIHGVTLVYTCGNTEANSQSTIHFRKPLVYIFDIAIGIQPLGKFPQTLAEIKLAAL